MKKRIFDYIKENPKANIHEISNAINEDETTVLIALAELSKEGYICICPPVPLSVYNSDSCRYKIAKQEYLED